MYRTLFLFLLLCHRGFAGFESHTAGGRHAALAGADLALVGVVWSLAYNPASLIDINHPVGSVSVSPQPFGLHELSSTSLGFAVPGHLGVFAFGVDRFGFDLYREITITAGYANKLGGIAFGVAINYYSYSIARYGSSGTLGLDAGLLVPVAPRLTFAIEGENINAPTIGTISDRLPQSFTVGVAYLPVDSITVEFDIRKEIWFDPTPRVGIEYRPGRFVALRFGFSQTPPLVSMGFGICFSVFELDYAYTSHQDLGGTQQLSLTIHEGR
jgi:hypothetical protein